MTSAAQILGPAGPLSRARPGFTARQAQIELATAVEQAAADGAILIAEAGTGTGKTFAYLVPALQSGGKVLISTGTRTLQDQLFHRDLPEVQRLLGVPAVVALLKGRSNYICLQALEETAESGWFQSKDEAAQVEQVLHFVRRSRRGDRSELSGIAEDAPVWSRLVSTRESCRGSECAHYEDCYVMKARREAAQADVVVVNHALFLADLALREEGITDLLPQADLVIFDEAHQLPQSASRFFSESVSLTQLQEWSREALGAALKHSPESADWSAWAREIEAALRALRAGCTAVEQAPGQRLALDTLPEPDTYNALLTQALEALARLGQGIRAVQERHPDLELQARRSAELLEVLGRQRCGSRAEVSEPPQEGAFVQDSEMGSAPASVNAKTTTDAKEVWVRWIELQGQHLRWHAAPLSVARQFSRHKQEGQAWVFTSATLSVHGSFQHFIQQLGLHGARTASWASPFDYAEQGLLCVPEDLPQPASPEFSSAFLDCITPLVRANPGGTLVLCTTLRAVDRCADHLTEALGGEQPRRRVLRQGELGRHQLLEFFRKSHRSVLVGSASFWEGLDLPGDQLTLVLIDKLPFAPPDDPLTEARLRARREAGGNPFFEYQLPEAAMMLKQGAGRLIRSHQDRGVLLVGDVRLIQKPYGKLLWRGLPPFRRTRSATEAEAFLKQLPATKTT